MVGKWALAPRQTVQTDWLPNHESRLQPQMQALHQDDFTQEAEIILNINTQVSIKACPGYCLEESFSCPKKAEEN